MFTGDDGWAASVLTKTPSGSVFWFTRTLTLAQPPTKLSIVPKSPARCGIPVTRRIPAVFLAWDAVISN